jgi:uncharacterized RDD family membrane protein YckC
VEYEDRITIQTPEGVQLELLLAGLGSRFIGALVDLAIKLGLVLALALVLLVAGDLGLAVFTALAFLVLWGYDVLFEVLAGGRTPGKMAAGTRVLRERGEPIDFMSSAIRNVLRLIDGLPTSYVPGMISIIATSRNQRLGDLAAGTIVVVDRPAHAPAPAYTPPVGSGAVWDVSAVSGDELAAVRRFLARRTELDVGARNRLAYQLAAALQPKVPGSEDAPGPEQFLERLAGEKAARG